MTRKPLAVRVVVALGALGLLSRFAVSALSFGSNDIFAWSIFASAIREHGLFWLYLHDSSFNHPPLPGYLAAALSWLSEHSPFRFSIWFKLPVIAAEFGSAALLWRIWSRRKGLPAAALSLLVFGWSLDSILVSAYHGNTDCIFAFFCLLSAYLIEERGQDLAGGLALGAAINIKLIPVLLIAPFLARYRTRRGAALFIGGLAIAAIPYIPVLLVQGKSFYQNAIAYNSQLDHWGINEFLLALRGIRLEALAVSWINSYRTAGRSLILLSTLLLATAATRTLRWNRYQLGAMTLSLFLILTPGIGVQYTAQLVPLLCAASLPTAALYSTLSGLFIGLVYFLYWTGSIPAESHFLGMYPELAALFGLLAWWTLCGFVIKMLRQRGLASTDA